MNGAPVMAPLKITDCFGRLPTPRESRAMAHLAPALEAPQQEAGAGESTNTSAPRPPRPGSLFLWAGRFPLRYGYGLSLGGSLHSRD